MATEEKKNQERPAVYILTQEQINQIAAVGAKEGYLHSTWKRLPRRGTPHFKAICRRLREAQRRSWKQL